MLYPWLFSWTSRQFHLSYAFSHAITVPSKIMLIKLGLQLPHKLLEKDMATHSSTLAWRILWMEEPGRLLSVGSPRVGHDWSNLAVAHVIIVTCYILNQIFLEYHCSLENWVPPWRAHLPTLALIVYSKCYQFSSSALGKTSLPLRRNILVFPARPNYGYLLSFTISTFQDLFLIL